MSMVQGTGNPSPTVLSYYIPCRRGRVSRPGQAFPDLYHVGCAYRRVRDAARYGSDRRKFLQIVDMPLTRLDIFASQNRYIASQFDMISIPLAPQGISSAQHISSARRISKIPSGIYIDEGFALLPRRAYRVPSTYRAQSAYRKSHRGFISTRAKPSCREAIHF